MESLCRTWPNLLILRVPVIVIVLSVKLKTVVKKKRNNSKTNEMHSKENQWFVVFRVKEPKARQQKDKREMMIFFYRKVEVDIGKQLNIISSARARPSVFFFWFCFFHLEKYKMCADIKKMWFVPIAVVIVFVVEYIMYVDLENIRECLWQHEPTFVCGFLISFFLFEFIFLSFSSYIFLYQNKTKVINRLG